MVMTLLPAGVPVEEPEPLFEEFMLPPPQARAWAP